MTETSDSSLPPQIATVDQSGELWLPTSLDFPSDTSFDSHAVEIRQKGVFLFQRIAHVNFRDFSFA